MKLKSLVSALTLVGAASVASAASYPASLNIVDFQAAGEINTYEFTITAPVDVEVGGAWLGSFTNPKGAWTLFDTNGTAGDDTDDTALYGAKYGAALPTTFGLGSGSYYFFTANSKAAVFGASFTTPVPEPESYAMMLAGLGAIGFMARRRRSN